ASLARDGRSPCAGGVMVVLPDFASDDGKFDLFVHFHGNTQLVDESLAAVKLNAVAIVVNLGIGSGPYEQRYTPPGVFADLVERVKQTMQKRGLRDASVRRIALSAFSAGYGAVERSLQGPGVIDQVDSVLLLDGIHTAYDTKPQVDMAGIEPFVKFARAAVDGEKLFYITHSNIQTLEYASTRETTDGLLAVLGLEREKGGETPAMPDLPAVWGAV